MNWREILGVTPSEKTQRTRIPHNTQKAAKVSHSADNADSAHKPIEKDDSKLQQILTEACRNLAITPEEVERELAPEDIENWKFGTISDDALATFARAVLQRREMYQGIRPSHYTEYATCRHCGPIWLWFSGEVTGCPWCWNRIAGRPIPRPPVPSTDFLDE